MSEVIKLTQEELTQINSIAEQETVKISHLGNIEYQLSNLKTQKNTILKSIDELGTVRTDLMNKLQTRYGEGTINIDTGEFTSTK